MTMDHVRIAWSASVIIALALLAAPCLAQQASPDTATEATPEARQAPVPVAAPLTVAMLDFEAADPANPDLGKQIGEALTAFLSAEPGIRLVERATLLRMLQEQELNLTGLVDTDQAVKVGRLVGARIMVTGRAFVLGQRLFITAKLIGTETSLVDGILIKGAQGAAVDELVIELAEKVTTRLREAGPKLVAQNDSSDPLPALKAKLAGLARPVVAVVIVERHLAAPRASARQAIDPAVETEVKLLLRQCGFEIRDVPENELADWAKRAGAGQIDAWPRSLDGVDVVITGEAFSEFAARVGNLVSCSARAEINLIDRATGKITHANRTTTRAVDLSEQMAGKTALEKAGQAIGIGLLSHFADSLPPAQ